MNILMMGEYKPCRSTDPDCTCRDHHAWHKEDGQVEDNCYDGLRCCVDQMDVWFETGDKCRKHPHSYAEPGYCDTCFNEKKGGK
jgi:hypothetical protein